MKNKILKQKVKVSLKKQLLTLLEDDRDKTLKEALSFQHELKEKGVTQEVLTKVAIFNASMWMTIQLVQNIDKIAATKIIADDEIFEGIIEDTWKESFADEIKAFKKMKKIWLEKKGKK